MRVLAELGNEVSFKSDSSRFSMENIFPRFCTSIRRMRHSVSVRSSSRSLRQTMLAVRLTRSPHHSASSWTDSGLPR